MEKSPRFGKKCLKKLVRCDILNAMAVADQNHELLVCDDRTSYAKVVPDLCTICLVTSLYGNVLPKTTYWGR
jgi:hypothetical protein